MRFPFCRKAPWLVVFLFFPAVTMLAQSPDSASPPSQAIRVDVDRVNVGVIVTDAQNHFVENLRRQDFHIFDDGIEQPVTDFAPVDDPAQVVLLVEAGPAVYLLQSGHLRAAYALLDGLSSGDRIAVVRYANTPEGIIDFTPDKQSASGALEALHFNLGFAALNLSSCLSNVLDWLRTVQGKKTIVLLSTGVDTSPENVQQALLAHLATSEVRILAVSLTGVLRNPPPANKKKTPSAQAILSAQQFAEADQLLKVIAESTGGRAFFPMNDKDFTSAHAQIAQLVRHEYSLAFAPPVRDARSHSLEVRAVPSGSTGSSSAVVPSYRVDYRKAYLARRADLSQSDRPEK